MRVKAPFDWTEEQDEFSRTTGLIYSDSTGRLLGRIDYLLPVPNDDLPAKLLLYKNDGNLRGLDRIIEGFSVCDYSGVVYPPQSVDLGVGNYTTSNEAQQAVERWWVYWLGQEQ